MEEDIGKQHTEERENRRRGLIGTIAFHILVLILLILPLLSFPVPPPGQQGILVSLGEPDKGEGDDRPQTQNVEQVEAQSAAEAEKQVEPEVKPASTSAPESRKEVVTSETPEEIAIRKAKEEEARRKRQQELEEQRRLEEERRKAQAEAQRQAEEEARKQAEYEKSKQQFGELFSGSGKGQTNSPGNQGSPTGDPDATRLEGISTGSGMVGDGLDNRGVLYEPDISDNSQKVGRVVVDVCVDRSGDVISATYTQRGSTTTDSDLRALAEKSARQFRFTESDVVRQCGTITIDFKVQ